MYHGRLPAQLLDRLDDTCGEEHEALVILLGQQVCLQALLGEGTEIVVVVDEIDLHPRGEECGDLDDEGVVIVVDDQVKSRQTYHLVKLVAPFVDAAVFGGEYSYLELLAVDTLGYVAAECGHGRVGHVGRHLLGYEQDFLCLHLSGIGDVLDCFTGLLMNDACGHASARVRGGGESSRTRFQNRAWKRGAKLRKIIHSVVMD